MLMRVAALGVSIAYPDKFGEAPGSQLTEAMDLARGGRFCQVRMSPQTEHVHPRPVLCAALAAFMLGFRFHRCTPLRPSIATMM